MYISDEKKRLVVSVTDVRARDVRRTSHWRRNGTKGFGANPWAKSYCDVGVVDRVQNSPKNFFLGLSLVVVVVVFFFPYPLMSFTLGAL